MSSADKYIPLIDEVINRNPVAVRLNVIRLGLGDESFQLSRQSLMVSISQWKEKNQADDQQVSNMIGEVLKVDKALQFAISDLTKKQPRDVDYPVWMDYLIMGIFFFMVVGITVFTVQQLKKLF